MGAYYLNVHNLNIFYRASTFVGFKTMVNYIYFYDAIKKMKNYLIHELFNALMLAWPKSKLTLIFALTQDCIYFFLQF